jgi:hypothetical protein
MPLEVEIIDAIQERIERDGISALTEPERYYRAIYFLEGEANNGSFHQFFWNLPGSLAHEALAALKAVGANRMAGLLDDAIALFPGRLIPDDDAARQMLLDDLGEATTATMNRLSDRFIDYPDDLGRLVDSYVGTHNEEFRGPRILLEMWQSKRSRGVDTTPRVVTRQIDFAVEAERDRPYSSRPCPVCDYPSPDYRKTCKRCGFPHGRVNAAAP